jgi:hypothetical protein
LPALSHVNATSDGLREMTWSAVSSKFGATIEPLPTLK